MLHPGGRGQVRVVEYTRGDRCKRCPSPRETKGAGISSPVAGEDDEFDQMDAEEREEATSGTSHRVAWRRTRAYLVAVLKTRCITLPTQADL